MHWWDWTCANAISLSCILPIFYPFSIALFQTPQQHVLRGIHSILHAVPLSEHVHLIPNQKLNSNPWEADLKDVTWICVCTALIGLLVSCDMHLPWHDSISAPGGEMWKQFVSCWSSHRLPLTLPPPPPSSCTSSTLPSTALTHSKSWPLAQVIEVIRYISKSLDHRWYSTQFKDSC